jgi:gas vesicle protein
MGPAIGAIVGVTTATIDAGTRAQATEDLAKENNRRFLATAEASNEGFLRFAEDVRTRTTEERSQIAAEVESIVTRALTSRGAAVASAGAGGVAGRSVAATTDEVARQASTQRANLSVLQRFRERAAARQIDSARINTTLRNLAALPPAIPTPSLLGTLSGITAAGFTGAGAGKQLQGVGVGGGGGGG